eukprot:9319107-Alexandrium_andersonii.AAC.1
MEIPTQISRWPIRRSGPKGALWGRQCPTAQWWATPGLGVEAYIEVPGVPLDSQSSVSAQREGRCTALKTARA